MMTFGEDNHSMITNDTLKLTLGNNESNANANNETKNSSSENVTNSSIGNELKFYHDFMESNKEFLEKMGFKDISFDPIFELEREVNPINANAYLCEICKKEISRFFSKNKNCKFCGCSLCDKCSNLKRKMPKSNSANLSTICLICDKKFNNFESHTDFKEKLIRKEFEISEANQKLESVSLMHSEQLDEMNKLKEQIMRKKRESETKEEMIQGEIKIVKSKADEICDQSERSSMKINEAINFLKSFDEKKKQKEKEYNTILRDREDIAYQFEQKQNYLNDILAKINQLSMTLKNHEQNIEQKENEMMKKQTGNKKLDNLLKEKMINQRKNFDELTRISMKHSVGPCSAVSNTKSFHQSRSLSETIIINPSKVMREIYKEPLLPKDHKKDGAVKKFVMYMGSKIFIKDK